MADSACLMQHPFSYTSGFPNEAMEGNHPIHALGQSVSFGRFTSESLAWEKWSTFSQNRYVEEAEKFSRPGSVAQKKAFFEAHYKKVAAQRAAALLEQANAAAASDPVAETETEQNVHEFGCSASPPSTMSSSNGAHQQEVEVATAQDFVAIDNGNGCGSDLKEEKSEGADAGIAHQMIDAIPQKIELKIEVEGIDLNGVLTENEFNQTPQMKKSISKSSRQNLEQPTTISKKKATSSSSSKLPLFNRSSKIPSTPAKPTAANSSSSSKIPLFNRSSKIPSTPAKPTAATSCLNNATPKQVASANKYVLESADKRKSTPKSLRMAVNFTPIRELNKFTSSVIRKIERSKVGPSYSKPAKDCSTPLRTPNTALKSEAQKHPSATPWSEKRSLRTEERAARRKEKLEEKFYTNEPQKKVQLQTKLKEKAETEITKLRQSFCFKARPLPDFYKERKAQKNEVSTSHPPSLGRNTNPKTGEATMSHSGHRLPVKSSRSNNKNVQGKAHSLSLQTLMSAHENTSPNIQQ
ncbi:protein WVD2-like 7 isoform X2 [Momordica charantia]|uniref:Protein WVD2-like 7 isoform X2 n=1 Tax=Momordica charantia TaxID=3673 RepID=A0A6J1C232_MOMCH|nr:protein WVD2-like 7 isoform X2 [Momordica charantia]